jgi:pentatricopeptide repeat protein
MSNYLRHGKGAGTERAGPPRTGLGKPEPSDPRKLLRAARILMDAGNLSAAEEMLHGILDENPRCRQAISGLIAVCGRKGDLDMATDVFDDATDDGLLDAHICTAMIKAYGHAGEQGSVSEVLELAEERNLTDGILYSAAVDVFRKSGAFHMAVDAFARAKERGQADIFLYTSMIQGYGDNRRPQEALALFDEVRASADKHVYTAIISACGKSRLISRARAFFDEAVGKGHADSRTFTSMLRTYRVCGMSREMDDVFERAVREGFADDNLIQAYGRS